MHKVKTLTAGKWSVGDSYTKTNVLDMAPLEIIYRKRRASLGWKAENLCLKNKISVEKGWYIELGFKTHINSNEKQSLTFK